MKDEFNIGGMIPMQNVINLPFDGKGKSPVEAAELIGSELCKFEGAEVKFVVPGFWSWRDHWYELMTMLIQILNQNHRGFSFIPYRDKNTAELSVRAQRRI